MGQNDIFDGLERRRAAIQQVQDNSAQPDFCSAFHTISGVGAVFEPTCFSFGTAFMDKPVFTFGSEIIGSTSAPPAASASVYKWRQTSNGFYTGAYVGFYVGSTVSDVGDLQTIFHLKWNGIRIKNFISSLGFPVQSLDI